MLIQCKACIISASLAGSFLVTKLNRNNGQLWHCSLLVNIMGKQSCRILLLSYLSECVGVVVNLMWIMARLRLADRISLQIALRSLPPKFQLPWTCATASSSFVPIHWLSKCLLGSLHKYNWRQYLSYFWTNITIASEGPPILKNTLSVFTKIKSL